MGTQIRLLIHIVSCRKGHMILHTLRLAFLLLFSMDRRKPYVDYHAIERKFVI